MVGLIQVLLPYHSSTVPVCTYRVPRSCLLFSYQDIDVIGPCDLLTSATKRLLKGVSFYAPIPESTIGAAPDFTIHHMAESANQPLIARHVSAGKLLFTTCTGSAVVASSGALDGRVATVSHLEYNWVGARYPPVHWTKGKKWVVDGKIWTAGGAVAGMDMVAHWIQREFGYNDEPRGQEGLVGRRVATHVLP
ncbi:class I glutamine amidotransferase-like protein [Aspergillus filifer]